MDVISMHQAGIDTAVCACGTALTPDQVKLISQYAEEVILSYDSDEAGQKATLRSLELFRNIPVKVALLYVAEVLVLRYTMDDPENANAAQDRTSEALAVKML